MVQVAFSHKATRFGLTLKCSSFNLGEPDSYVHGSVIEGVFAGRIRHKRDVFYVEKSELYFKDKPDFHSVIYHDRHVDENAVRCVCV